MVFPVAYIFGTAVCALGLFAPTVYAEMGGASSQTIVIPQVRRQNEEGSGRAPKDWSKAKTIYEFTVNDINGQPVSLEKYRGYVLLIVNVASRCGLTASNYRELVELHNKYHDSKGLKILAFPCNQFSSQEPGSNDDIICFAKAKNAHFDFFDKIKVNGDDASPLWKFLKQEKGGSLGDMIKWNFTKFIVDRNGKVVERFGPTTEPLKLIPVLEKYF